MIFYWKKNLFTEQESGSGQEVNQWHIPPPLEHLMIIINKVLPVYVHFFNQEKKQRCKMDGYAF